MAVGKWFNMSKKGASAIEAEEAEEAEEEKWEEEEAEEEADAVGESGKKISRWNLTGISD